MQSTTSRPSDIMVAQTLRKTAMFSEVTSESLDRLTAGSELLSLPKGSYLFHEGARADGFYIVHRGGINVHRVTEDGKEQVIRIFYPAESFGEVVLVGDQTYPASAKASEESQVILIRTGFFRQQVHHDPDLALRILGSMSLHLKFLVDTVEDLKLRQAESRVTQWLIKEFQSRDFNNRTGPATITLPCAKHLLASQLGITSETFSRVLAQMRRQNLIEVDGRNITIHSMEGVRDFGRPA